MHRPKAGSSLAFLYKAWVFCPSAICISSALMTKRTTVPPAVRRWSRPLHREGDGHWTVVCHDLRPMTSPTCIHESASGSKVNLERQVRAGMSHSTFASATVGSGSIRDCRRRFAEPLSGLRGNAHVRYMYGSVTQRRRRIDVCCFLLQISPAGLDCDGWTLLPCRSMRSLAALPRPAGGTEPMFEFFHSGSPSAFDQRHQFHVCQAGFDLIPAILVG